MKLLVKNQTKSLTSSEWTQEIQGLIVDRMVLSEKEIPHVGDQVAFRGKDYEVTKVWAEMFTLDGKLWDVGLAGEPIKR